MKKKDNKFKFFVIISLFLIIISMTYIGITMPKRVCHTEINVEKWTASLYDSSKRTDIRNNIICEEPIIVSSYKGLGYHTAWALLSNVDGLGKSCLIETKIKVCKIK